MSARVIRIKRLPATAAGRQLLREALPFMVDGTFPGGSRLEEIDFDELAIQVERDVADYMQWCAEHDGDGVGRAM